MLRADWAIVIALIGLLATVYVEVRQIELADRQLQLMEKQDEILNRRADFAVSLKPVMGLNGEQYNVVVTNTGLKTARDFYFDIRVTVSKIRGAGNDGVSDYQQTKDADGRDQIRFVGLIPTPLYPTREQSVGHIMLEAKPTDSKIQWQIAAEDGIFRSPTSTTSK